MDKLEDVLGHEFTVHQAPRHMLFDNDDDRVVWDHDPTIEGMEGRVRIWVDTVLEQEQEQIDMVADERTRSRGKDYQHNEDHHIGIDGRDRLKRTVYDKQHNRTTVPHIDDFQSELGIMSNGNVLPTSTRAPKKRKRQVSRDIMLWSLRCFLCECANDS